MAATVEKVTPVLPCQRSTCCWPSCHWHEPYRTWQADGRDVRSVGQHGNPENCILIVFACDFSSSASCHFHYLVHYPVACWYPLNLIQQSWFNTHDDKYRDIRGVQGCDKGSEQGIKDKEFHCRWGQVALMAKSSAPDLVFSWEPTPATTLATMVPY